MARGTTAGPQPSAAPAAGVRPVHRVEAPGDARLAPVPASLRALQRTAGNAAVGRLLSVQRDPLVSVDPSAAGPTSSTPPNSSSAAPPGAHVLAPPTVTLPGRISTPDNPAGVPDRLAPGRPVSVAVGVSGLEVPGAAVTLSVEGSGTAAGTVTVNGAASTDLVTSAPVTLTGTAQTSPGSAGGLRLVAKQGTVELARSTPFSVAALPRNYTDTFLSLLTDRRRGFVVQDGWDSDGSGGLADLGEAQISEMVEYGTGTGCFAGAAPGNNSGYLPADRLTTDTHSRGVAELTRPGTLVATQTCKVNDARTGARDIPMVASGYVLTRVVEVKPSTGLLDALRKAAGAVEPKDLTITTSKVGAATSAKGVPSAAGVGVVVKKQDVVTGAEVP